jgi:multiple sugar transport system ATP-binding protein
MASVTFEAVTKRYNDVVAVDGLDLVIEDQEFLVLVGPSGSGKSTALRLLAGLEPVSDGHIRIGDRDVTNVAAKDRDIAMVFQTYALYPHMTVLENMAFGLSIRHVPKAEIDRRVSEAAGLLGISELLKRKPRQLSGGQRQRVALGRAIVRDPAVFLLDEPLSNLDAQLRVQTRAEITKLHQRLGTTFVYVTHDQVEAMTMATRIAVMEKGRLQQVGPPQELYDHPANLFVAGFIGSPAMNLFEMPVVSREGGQLALEHKGFMVPVPASRLNALRSGLGTTVMAGIRPEHIRPRGSQPPAADDFEIRAFVDVAEALGNETIAHLTTAGQPFLARLDPHVPCRPGMELRLEASAEDVHLFSKDTGLALPMETGRASVPSSV